MTTRRKLLIAGSLAALAATLSALGQQSGRVWRIGFLSAASRTGSSESAYGSFLQGMRESGYVERRNLIVEDRYAEGIIERLPELAAELVELKVDLILAWATPAVIATRRATSDIPIVMVGVADPVGSGLVATLARPGGNITGVSNLSRDLSSKMVELLVAVVPGINRLAVLRIPANPSSALQLQETEAAARSMNLALQVVELRSAAELDAAFASMSRSRAMGVIIFPEPMMVSERHRIADLALRNRLPTIFARRENVEAGGLLSYGSSLSDQFRYAATFVDKILKGAKPGDLPVEQPTKFELVINMKTAKALGLTMPQSLLLRADEVIE